MDGVDRIRFRTPGRRRSLKEWLGIRSMGCWGTTWNFRSSNSINVSDSENEAQHEEHNPGQVRSSGVMPDRNCPDRSLITGGRNLAAALAAERQYWTEEGSSNEVGATDNENGNAGGPRSVTEPRTPSRVSLTRLLAESDGCDGEVGNVTMCCVCMGRKKGAAFIPCGHTFCRVCSRELWLNRGSCPLCNRPILDILDIF